MTERLSTPRAVVLVIVAVTLVGVIAGTALSADIVPVMTLPAAPAMAALAAAFAATTCWMWRTAGSWSDAASVSERLSAPVAALVVLAVGITVTPSVAALIG